jgi:hypothetical protein
MILGGHPQNFLTPAQMAQQPQQAVFSYRAKLRSRKPTDKNILESVEDRIIGDGWRGYEVYGVEGCGETMGCYNDEEGIGYSGCY